MRGRLLDMGELDALRWRSICAAIASTMRPGDPPAVVLSLVAGEIRVVIVAPQALPGSEALAQFEAGRLGEVWCFSGRSAPDRAEALVSSIESQCGLELIPSMPTPEEMQAVWESERKPTAGENAWTKEASSCS